MLLHQSERWRQENTQKLTGQLYQVVNKRQPYVNKVVGKDQYPKLYSDRKISTMAHTHLQLPEHSQRKGGRESGRGRGRDHEIKNIERKKIRTKGY